MTTRRGFLCAMLAAGVAPAIVHNPMKLWVPKQEIVQVTRVGSAPGSWNQVAKWHTHDIKRSLLFGIAHELQCGDIITTSDGLLAVVATVISDRQIVLAPQTGRYERFEKELAQADRLCQRR